MQHSKTTKTIVTHDVFKCTYIISVYQLLTDLHVVDACVMDAILLNSSAICTEKNDFQLITCYAGI